MLRENLITAVVFVLFCINKTQGCVQRNTSCSHIKADGGFQFPLKCPVGGEVLVSDSENQTIAHGTVGAQSFKFSDKVFKADDHCLVTRDCRDLKVKCIVDEDIFIKEDCMFYRITETLKNVSDPPTPRGLDIGVGLAVLLLIGIIGLIGLICSYTSWKKRQHSAGFLTYLRTCSCLRKDSETEETRVVCLLNIPGGGDVLQVVAADTAQTNIRLSVLSASDPRGSGQNNNKQDGRPGSVEANGIDPNAEPCSLDRSRTDAGIHSDKNGEVNRASYHRDINRGLRDDPGGVNNNGGEDAVRVAPAGRPLLDRGPEEKPVLSAEGAAVQDSDMTAEAAALVNKRGFDPGRDGRRSTATVTDEESMLNTKNYNITIY